MSEEKAAAVSPLRQRMIEDMITRRLSEKTQAAHIRAVMRLAKFLGRSPDTVSGEDLRRFSGRTVGLPARVGQSRSRVCQLRTTGE